MTSYREFEARMAVTQQKLDKQFEEMNKIVDRMVTSYNREALETMAEEEMHNRFDLGVTVNFYTWTYSYSFLPSRKCFTTQELITPGTKAYKGVKKKITADSNFEYEFLPKEMWLTKEEFILRRLRGQI